MTNHQMIPVNTPLLDGNEAKYLSECIETGWISSEGPFVSRFEQAFAAKVESPARDRLRQRIRRNRYRCCRSGNRTG